MKFSIRDLFLVTLIVAVCVAWWVDHRRQAAEIRWRDHRRQAVERRGQALGYGIEGFTSAPAPNPPNP